MTAPARAGAVVPPRRMGRLGLRGRTLAARRRVRRLPRAGGRRPRAGGRPLGDHGRRWEAGRGDGAGRPGGRV